MPDQVLRWVSEIAPGDRSRDFKIVMPDPTISNSIIHHYQAVNDALNDQMYVPVRTDTHARCRGYLAGFAADMTALAPLTAARPKLLKVIMLGAGEEDLADAVGQMHAFRVERRRRGVDLTSRLGQAAALKLGQAAQPNQRLH